MRGYATSYNEFWKSEYLTCRNISNGLIIQVELQF